MRAHCSRLGVSAFTFPITLLILPWVHFTAVFRIVAAVLQSDDRRNIDRKKDSVKDLKAEASVHVDCTFV